MKKTALKKSMKSIGHLLRDPETGFLWLHDLSWKNSYVVTANGIVDFKKCVQQDEEVVVVAGFGLCIASAEFVVVRNSEGLYAVLVPYQDSMGYGAIYRSLTPGFTFKSAFCYAINWEDYLLYENEEGKWGMYRLTNVLHHQWSDANTSFIIPISVPCSHCYTKEALMEYIPKGNANPHEWQKPELVNLTDPSIPNNLKNNTDSWGFTLEEIYQFDPVADLHNSFEREDENEKSTDSSCPSPTEDLPF